MPLWDEWSSYADFALFGRRHAHEHMFASASDGSKNKSNLAESEVPKLRVRDLNPEFLLQRQA